MTESNERPEQETDLLSVDELIKQAQKVISQLKYSELHKKIEMRNRSFGR